IQDIVVRLQWECERLSSVTGGLLQDFQQKEKDTEALFQSLEELKKDKAEEQYLLLTVIWESQKADKAALGTKVNCTQFEACMERLEGRMQEVLSRVSGQEQCWHEMQKQLSDIMDSKLDRLGLRPFQKQVEKTWKTIKELKEGVKTEHDDTAGIE
ncbi:QRIC2 protein, partial [Machaerirhynchus nigripectus]|nr:QRIC2 protein [Machaerirhynchus nigripectus]